VPAPVKRTGNATQGDTSFHSFTSAFAGLPAPPRLLSRSKTERSGRPSLVRQLTMGSWRSGMIAWCLSWTGDSPASSPRKGKHLNEPGRWDFFLSYTQRSGHGREITTQLSATVPNQPHLRTIWHDVRMHTLDDEAMEEGVKGCKVLICVMTQDGDGPGDWYMRRRACVRELRWAIKYGKPIVPVVHTSDKPRVGEYIEEAMFLGDVDGGVGLSFGKTNFVHFDSGGPEFLEASIKTILKQADQALERGARVREATAEEMKQAREMRNRRRLYRGSTNELMEGNTAAQMEKIYESAKRGGFSCLGLFSCTDPDEKEDGDEKRQKAPWYILSPDAAAMKTWDAALASALIFTAIVTPYEVAFLGPTDDASNPIFILNRLVDAILLLDMGMQFLLKYRVRSERTDREWETRLKPIARRYLTGWFTIDLLSILPSLFDVLPFFIPGLPDSLHTFKAMRILRVLRLVKLTRLVRTSRVLKRWQARVSIPQAKISLLAIWCMLLLGLHWLACALGLLAVMEDIADSVLHSWLSTFGYCVPDDGQVGCPARHRCSDAIFDDFLCTSSGELYVTCMWWGLGILLNFQAAPFMGPFEVDPSEQGAFEVAEQGVLVALKVLAAMVWSYALSKMISCVSNADQQMNEWLNGLDGLNRFIDSSKLHLSPIEAQGLREYYLETKEAHEAANRMRACLKLSPHLHSMAAFKLNKHWLTKLSFYENIAKPVLAKLATGVEIVVFAPLERPPALRLYVIQRGSARFGGSILSTWESFGEIILSEVLIKLGRPFRTAQAVNYLHAFRISADQLNALAEEFPVEFQKIKAPYGQRVVFNKMLQVARELEPEKLKNARMNTMVVARLSTRSQRLSSDPKAPAPSSRWRNSSRLSGAAKSFRLSGAAKSFRLSGRSRSSSSTPTSADAETPAVAPSSAGPSVPIASTSDLDDPATAFRISGDFNSEQTRRPEAEQMKI